MFSFVRPLDFIPFRFICLAFSTSWFVPDEVFQSTEVAYHLVFGHGHLAWEWDASWALRSSLHPLLYALIFWVLRFFRLDFGPLIRWAPHFLHALLFLLADAFYFKWTQKLGLSYRVQQLNLTLYAFNWFLLYCSTRTLSNSIECCLSLIALYFYEFNEIKGPKNSKIAPSSLRRLSLCLFLVAISTILRPTTLFLWFQLILLRIWHLFNVVGFSITNSTTVILRLAPFFLAPFCLSFLVDSLYYGKPVLCMWNFLQFNILRGGSANFGANHWSWYLTHAAPPLLTFLIVPLLTSLLHFGHLNMDKKYAMAALIYFIGHSLVSHKEHRFLLPILPLIFPYLAIELSSYKSRWIKAIKYCYIFLNLLLAIYFGLIHQRGPSAVNGHLIDLIEHWGRGRDRIKILQLMPCFSLPQYAHLHPYGNKIDIKMLDCSPKFFRVPHGDTDDLDETDKFNKNPEGWLNTNWYRSSLFDADIVIAYEHVYQRIERFLLEKGFVRDSRIFHTHFSTSSTISSWIVIVTRTF